MAFNVTEFRNHFAKHNDFAKPSKFDVRISPPPGLGLNTADLRFQCEATELPGYSINTVDARYYGVSSFIASFSTFADITLTFICAGDFWEKKLFDRWMHLIVPINDYNPNYKDVYTSPKIIINQFSEVASESNSAPIIYNASLFGAFPVNIAPLSVNWAEDGVHRLAVTFKYEYWITGDLEKVSRPPVDRPTEPPRVSAPAAAGGTLPVIENKPVSVPQNKPLPLKPGGGSFAGGGASGNF
jgi:hypothetical protein